MVDPIQDGEYPPKPPGAEQPWPDNCYRYISTYNWSHTHIEVVRLYSGEYRIHLMRPPTDMNIDETFPVIKDELPTEESIRFYMNEVGIPSYVPIYWEVE
jgi:hypothetical protein